MDGKMIMCIKRRKKKKKKQKFNVQQPQLLSMENNFESWD